MIGYLRYKLWLFTDVARKRSLVPKTFMYFFFVVAMLMWFIGRNLAAAASLAVSAGFYLAYDFSRGEWKHWEREQHKKEWEKVHGKREVEKIEGI